MSDEYNGQELDARTEEFLEHFGVKGMKWGVRKAGSIATAPARQGLKNAKAAVELHSKATSSLRSAVKTHNAKQKLADEAYVKKYGELGATLRAGGQRAAAAILINAGTRKLAVKTLRTNPRRAAGIAVAGAALSTGLLVSQISAMNRIDSAANRINSKRGYAKGTYVSASKKRK